MKCKPVSNSFYLCLYKDHTTEGHYERERLEYGTIQCTTRYVVVINEKCVQVLVELCS